MTGNRDVRRRRAGGIERHTYDVVVIGAGGAGLRAAIAAHEAGAKVADRLQVPARQGAHGDGRGRHRRGHGQPLARGQLGGALPRHHAWREDAQQLADGPAARPGGARAGPRARGLGRAVRPHRGRPDLAARLRRPPLRPPRPRRRPHRPGDDPHPPAARGAARHRRVHGVHGHRPAQGRRRRGSPAPSATGARPAASSPSRRRRSSSPPAASARASRSPPTPGSTPATATRWPCAPARS